MSAVQVDDQAVLERALRPGGLLESVRVEIEAEIEAEQRAAAARLKKQETAAASALDSTRESYRLARDTQWEAAKAFTATTEELLPLERAYKAAQRECRRLGLNVQPIELDYFRQSQARSSSIEMHHEVQSVIDALRRGIYSA